MDFAKEPPRYPNGTPVNLLGVPDWETLRVLEYEAAYGRSFNLIKGAVDIDRTFDAAHLCAIHHYLFQDVYEWAGQLRTCSISKELQVDDERLVTYFCEPKFFKEEFAALQEKTSTFAHASDMSDWDKTSALVDVFVLANHIHPFPEGNGRTLRIFMEQLANTQGLHLDFSKVEVGDWSLACAVSGIYGRMDAEGFERFRPDHRPIFQIFERFVAPRISLESGSIFDP